MHTLFATSIYGPRGRTTEALAGKKVLDLGCGAAKLPGAVGVDSLPLPGVDVVHDLDARPWPFPDNHFDIVYANHYLEHTGDVLATLGEVHRVLKQGGHAVLQVPYFRSTDAVTDPTHKHFFAAATLDYVCAGTGLAAYSYVPYRFKKAGFWYGWPGGSRNPFARAFKRFITRHSGFYDQYLSLLLPVKCLTWELEAIHPS